MAVAEPFFSGGAECRYGYNIIVYPHSIDKGIRYISSFLVCDMQMPFHCVFNHGVSKSQEKVCGEGMLPEVLLSIWFRGSTCNFISHRHSPLNYASTYFRLLNNLNNTYWTERERERVLVVFLLTLCWCNHKFFFCEIWEVSITG